MFAAGSLRPPFISIETAISKNNSDNMHYLSKSIDRTKNEKEEDKKTGSIII